MMNLLQLYNDAYRSVLSRIKALDGSLLLRRIGWNLLITVAFALFTSLRKEQGDYYMSVFIPLFGATSAITLIGCLFKAPTVISMIYSLLITMGAAIQIFARSGEDSMSFAHRYVILIYIALVVALVALPLLKKLTMSGKLKSIRWGLMAAIVVLFVAVLVFGDEQNGAKSWINLGWFSIQITEITKLLQLVLLSVVLADRALSEQTRFFWCIASLVVAGLFYFLASELGTLLLYGIAHFVLRLLFAEKRQWVFAEIGVVSVVLVVGLLSCYLIYKNHTPVLENTESIQTETTDTQEPVDTGLMSRLAKIWPKLTKRFNVFIDTSDSAD
ncbi:MAG: FtsW/RodA/SpoVE family cell cycle protein, partial [Clostridia bacterium]|nr:FtsW/RodA/SpoVE family cell cycle protein [Clostridia bacterium]